MRNLSVKAVLLAGALLALLAAAAYAVSTNIEIGNTRVSVSADIEPRALPAHGGAPVTIRSATRIDSRNGAAPSALTKLVFVFDKHGFVETRGLPVCTAAKLAGATPRQARQRCAGAIVGEGVGRADVRLPGQAPVQISSPLTLFNAPATGGDPGLIVHAYETLPTPKAVVVPFSVERIKRGRYGFRAEIELPPIAEGYGSATLAEATVGKTWKRGGRTVGYVNASCAGGRLQIYGTLSLADGSRFPGTLVSPCHEPR
jgi:hypothetical protein